MIATIDVEIQAANLTMPLYPWRAFKGSSTSLRIRNVPKKIGTWQIETIQVTVTYPDNAIKKCNATLVGGVWCATLPESMRAGNVKNGYTITASGTDENGSYISNWTLGKGDVEILGEIADGDIDVSAVKLYASKPSDIKNGDCWFEDDILVICDNDTEKRIEGFKPNTAQQAALNSGITSNKVANYDSAYAKVPAQTFEPNNELADKAFVNSSVQTATANFRGNWPTFEDVPSNANEYPEDYQGIKTPTTNDYLVVENYNNTGTWRFKYVGNWEVDGKTGWKQEYQVNETPLTANQLAALNSGITSDKVSKIDSAMPYYKFVETKLETLIFEDVTFQAYRFKPFCNNVVNNIETPNLVTILDAIQNNIVRDLIISIPDAEFEMQLFSQDEGFIPVNNDEENLIITNGKTNIFYLTEIPQGNFLVSKQVV